MPQLEPDKAAYVAIMYDIKWRTSHVRHLLSQKVTDERYAAQVESMTLQVRIVTELIALSSIAANRKLFEENRIKFAKHWRPNDILKDVQRLNPGFYPYPLQEVASETPGVKGHLADITKGYLTKDQLIALHGRCGDLLHAKNPYKRKIDYGQYERTIPQWLDQIQVLLNCHKIQLLDSRVFYLVHMKENRDDQVHMYTLQEVIRGL